MKRHSAPAQSPADLGHPLNRADLRTGRLQGDQRRIRPQRLRHRVRVDAAIAVHGEVAHAVAPLLEVPTRVQHGDVLDRGRDDVTSRVPGGKSLHRKIVCLGGGRGEDHARGGAAHESGDLGAGAVERCAGFEAEGVAGRGIAGTAFEKRPHHRHDPRIDRGKPGVVEVRACEPGGPGATGSFG